MYTGHEKGRKKSVKRSMDVGAKCALRYMYVYLSIDRWVVLGHRRRENIFIINSGSER